MPICRKKQQDRQHIQQRCRRGHRRLRARVIGPRHAHAHLGVDDFPGLFGDVEKKLHNDSERRPDAEFEQQLHRKFQRGPRHHCPGLVGRVGGH